MVEVILIVVAVWFAIGLLAVLGLGALAIRDRRRGDGPRETSSASS